MRSEFTNILNFLILSVLLAEELRIKAAFTLQVLMLNLSSWLRSDFFVWLFTLQFKCYHDQTPV